MNYDNLKDFVLTNYTGNNNYLCYKDTDTNYVCIFGFISHSGLTFTSDSSKNCVISNDFKITCDTGSSNVTLNSDTVAYTNIIGIDYTDLLASYKFNQLHNVAYNLDLNYFMALMCFVLLPVVVGFVHHFFVISEVNDFSR